MTSISSSETTAESEEYVDWLEEVTQQGGEFAWIFRAKHFYESTSVFKTVADVKTAVLASATVRAEITAEVARRSGDPKAADAVLKSACQILSEMEHNFQLNVVRSVGYALVKAVKAMYKSIFVNMRRLREVRAACQRDTRVAFMPTHCSYMDFLLISLLCFHVDVQLPAVCAGEDFRASALLGGVLRRCGAFLIRRSFGNDRLYWVIFSEYVQMHIIENLRPVEFFVEGMRSRSGKSLPPKTGFLQTILDPFFASKVYDILLVPVTINYDRLLEENLYARELLGTPKPKETAYGLFKARDVICDSFGNIHVTFAPAISVRDHFANCAASHQLRTRHSFMAAGYPLEWSEPSRAAVRRLAHIVIETHRKHSVLTVWPLICHALLRENCRTSCRQLTHTIIDILGLLSRLSVKVKILSTSLDEDIRFFLELHQNVVIQDGDVLTLNLPVDEPVVERMARRLLIANYANALSALVADVALVSVSIAPRIRFETQLHIDDVLSDYQFLSEMLGREFIGVPNESRNAFNVARNRLEQASILFAEGEMITVVDAVALTDIQAIIEPWLECYALLICASENVLADHPMVSNGDFVEMCRRQSISLLTAVDVGDWRVRCLSADVMRNVFTIIKERAVGKTEKVDFAKIQIFAERLDAFVPNFAARLRKKSCVNTDSHISPKL